MDWLISFVGAQVPLGAVAVAGALGIVSGRLFRRAVLVEERQRAEQAERAARFATGRVAVQQPTSEALTRALTGPTEVAGSDLPPRGVLDATAVAADYLPPAMVETAAQDAQALLDQTVPSLDLDGAYDVYGTDDEPDDADDSGDPPGEVPVPAVTFVAILPRYDWSHARPWPAAKGVTPDRWSMYRWKAGRWVTRARTMWSQLRAYLAERWEAIDWDRSPGWAPGEATQVMTGEQPAVVFTPEPAPITRPPRHLAGYRKVWAAVLVDEFRATGAAGRHRIGVAAGALAQRQGRLLALPAGVR